MRKEREAVTNDSDNAPVRRRVWDAPVRVMHALLVLCVAGAWLTRHADRIDLHALFGYLATIAVALRVAWGFVGSRHARFRDFAYSPAAALAYVGDAMRGRARHYTGHNPAGSWAVYLLLASIAATCVTGLVAIAAMHGLGPLAPMPASDEAARLAWDAHEMLAWLVLALAMAHLAGVAWGSHVHRENLAAAMASGMKLDHGGGHADVPARRGFAAAILVVAIALAAILLGVLAPRDVQGRESLEAAARESLAASAWGKECASCHLAYAPPLLPLRTWKRMLREQDRHFGEDLSLDASSVEALLAQARGWTRSSWAARALASSAPLAQEPLRITALAFWRETHSRLDPAELKPPFVAGPHECDGCHADAHSGTFHPRMIRKAKPRTSS